MLFTRYVLVQGKAPIREAVEQTALNDRGLRNCSAMLLGLKGGAASVVRASIHTAEVQDISFGLPAGLLDQPYPPAEAFNRRWPGYLFTVSAGGKPQAVNLLVPAPAAGDALTVIQEVAPMVRLMVLLSGQPDPAAGDPAEQQAQTVKDILASRPALLTALLNWPATNELLADLIGFTQYFGAAVLLDKQPAAATAAPTAAAAPAAADPQAAEIPFNQVTLEQLAELNRRSCLILTGRAQGSRPQAQAWDNWLESYRGANDRVMEAMLAPGRKVEADLFIMGRGFWTELPDGPYRFAATFNATSCYFIPRDARPVPNITDYTPG